MTKKICSARNCVHGSIEQNISNFNKNKSEKDGYERICKDCRRLKRESKREEKKISAREYYSTNRLRIQEDQRERYKKNNRSVRAKDLQRKYGISEEVAYLAVDNKIPCMICKSYDRVCIDHDHDTGMVRGFLCTKCNLAYGMLQENSKNIARLLTYAIASEKLKKLFEEI